MNEIIKKDNSFFIEKRQTESGISQGTIFNPSGSSWSSASVAFEKLRVYKIEIYVPGTFTFMPIYCEWLATSEEEAIKWLLKYVKNHHYKHGDKLESRDPYNEDDIGNILTSMRCFEEPGKHWTIE